MEFDGFGAGERGKVVVMLVEVVGRSCSADCPEPFALPLGSGGRQRGRPPAVATRALATTTIPHENLTMTVVF